ncbi:hypothetical protein MPSEU_000869500 [Mayamaea pseudoterrestris]|nr:hypothetical protein MPSEU_000869500 [Mayamaea pseudoterrestris]
MTMQKRRLQQIRGNYTTPPPCCCRYVPLLLLLATILLPSTCFAQDDDSNITSNNTDTSQPPFNVDGFLSLEDLQFCSSALEQSDANNDNEVDSDEYVTFSQLMNPTLDVISDIDNYRDMPLAFKAAFLRTACLCSLPDFGGDEDALSCCFGTAAHLRATTQRLYLYAACSYNLAAAETVRMPSHAPTNEPTIAATSEPTTMEPTVEPSMIPTTMAPSAAPTTNAVPTLAPSSVASQPSTRPSPAASPSLSPAPTTTKSSVQTARVAYRIRILDGQALFRTNSSFFDSYLNDLGAAMGLLAPQVVKDTFGDNGRRLYHGGKRRLNVVYGNQPDTIYTMQYVECPKGIPKTDVCQRIVDKVSLELSGKDANDPIATVDEYEATLSNAIARGDLAASLEQVSPDSPVIILDDTQKLGASPPQTPTDKAITDESGLSAGGAVGIAIGALVLIVPLALLAMRKKRRKSESAAAAELEKVPVKDIEENDNFSAAAVSGNDAASSVADKDVYIENEGAAAAAAAGGGTLLGAHAPNYGRKDRQQQQQDYELMDMDMGEDVMAEPGMDDDHHTTASSEAGNSGWSSSAGLSSLNTGSMDESMDAAMAAGTTLAAIGSTSALSRVVVEHGDDTETGASESDADIAPELARSQLDGLIEAGDWAAVGATAALLAAASDSASMDSKSHVTGRSERSRDTTRSGVDSARAAELDQLIDAGDWEGVVLAAAKFETAESGADTDGDHASMDATESEADMSNSRTGVSTSAGTSQSDSISQKARTAAIRKEVVELVERVVPEELDNVDEMMNQFKGREDELLETLRTMQERFIAQKARETNQKSAKIEARRTVREAAGMNAARTDTGPRQAVSPEASSGDVSARSADRSSIASVPSEERRTALESAIEAGDWEAVGAAAALMSDADTGSNNSGDISQLNEALSSVENSQRSQRSEISESDTARAARIDSLVGKSDWQGVVEATKLFSDEDKPLRSQEEEEALAEAEAWMKIAEDTKEGATDAAASEAAEWAIQKSLSQLQEEERQQGKKEPSGDDEDEV